MEMTRRNFMGAAVAMGAGAIVAANGMPAVANAAVEDELVGAYGVGLPWSGPGSVAGDWNGTPEEIKALGGCTMPLEELNARRKMYVDAQTDYTCADGTVIPAVYVKARALMNTYNFGVGCSVHDACFDWIIEGMTEDEAQAYIDMPYGKPFNAIMFSAHSGRPVEECEAYCDALFNKAWISRFVNDNGTFYFQVPYVQGFGEFHGPDFYTGKSSYAKYGTFLGSDVALSMGVDAGTIFLMSTPVSRDIVADGNLLPYDDLEAIWSTKNKFSLTPCFCRFKHALDENPDLELPNYPDGDFDLSDELGVCGHDLMTCLSCGEEAQFWIDHHCGREITKEEALERLHKSIEQGFVMQRINSNLAETICSCHGDCCNVLGAWKSITKNGTTGLTRTLRAMSHYDLVVNDETCAKCGACAQRCPMDAITMDEETGLPVITAGPCMVCGQCAYICPTKSRWLEVKEEGTFLPPFESIIEMNNVHAAERFELGLIY